MLKFLYDLEISKSINDDYRLLLKEETKGEKFNNYKNPNTIGTKDLDKSSKESLGLMSYINKNIHPFVRQNITEIKAPLLRFTSTVKKEILSFKDLVNKVIEQLNFDNIFFTRDPSNKNLYIFFPSKRDPHLPHLYDIVSDSQSFILDVINSLYKKFNKNNFNSTNIQITDPEKSECIKILQGLDANIFKKEDHSKLIKDFSFSLLNGVLKRIFRRIIDKEFHSISFIHFSNTKFVPYTYYTDHTFYNDKKMIIYLINSFIPIIDSGEEITKEKFTSIILEALKKRYPIFFSPEKMKEEEYGLEKIRQLKIDTTSTDKMDDKRSKKIKSGYFKNDDFVLRISLTKYAKDAKTKTHLVKLALVKNSVNNINEVTLIDLGGLLKNIDNMEIIVRINLDFRGFLLSTRRNASFNNNFGVFFEKEAKVKTVSQVPNTNNNIMTIPLNTSEPFLTLSSVFIKVLEEKLSSKTSSGNLNILHILSAILKENNNDYFSSMVDSFLVKKLSQINDYLNPEFLKLGNPLETIEKLVNDKFDNIKERINLHNVLKSSDDFENMSDERKLALKYYCLMSVVFYSLEVLKEIMDYVLKEESDSTNTDSNKK